MNMYQGIQSGQGMLKNAYPAGPRAQMNQQAPMAEAIRKRRGIVVSK